MARKCCKMSPPALQGRDQCRTKNTGESSPLLTSSDRLGSRPSKAQSLLQCHFCFCADQPVDLRVVDIYLFDFSTEVPFSYPRTAQPPVSDGRTLL